MFQLQDLTVGTVSGMIAAGIFAAQLLIPLALPVVLLGLQSDGSTVTASAVTWSVIGRFLHSSYWPSILFTDSTATAGVRKSVSVVSRLKILATVLIGVAAVVTPLGLYEDVASGKGPAIVPFHYLHDKSPLGYGTPLRANLSWSRICGGFAPVSCPNSPNNVTTSLNATGKYFYTEQWYDSHVPQYVIDLFESGLSTMGMSVSSIFDIQWRSYTWSQMDVKTLGDFAPDNGTMYPVGAFRQITSLLLDDAIVLAEGLIVDMKDGGIGFRNHSAPPSRPYGSTWSEDILFIEPETQCVDTNLTLDFSLPNASDHTFSTIINLVLTDRGGFANINHSYPTYNHNDTQNNPDLQLRAYKAAWINNVFSMEFMNVTNPINFSNPGSRQIKYLDSTVGKTFPLQYKDLDGPTLINVSPNTLQILQYGGYLSGIDRGVPGSNSSLGIGMNSSSPPLYPNTLGIDMGNFSDIITVCQGAGDLDYANITNFAAECGLMYGAPRRQDGTASLIFEPGSSWTVPMYSCVSATKAVIKTVYFSFNGSDDLSGLAVINLTDKIYPNDTSKPLWGVENTKMALADVKPLWGLVAPQSQGRVNLSTLQKESLWLPGYAGLTTAPLPKSYQNLPGVDFHTDALAGAYHVGHSSSGVDYSGESSLAMYRLWQDLSRTPQTAAKILNLIWTDIAANAVVGTKSMEALDGANPTRDNAGSDPNMIPVTVYRRQIKYNILYGIPAFAVLFYTLCTFITTSYMVLTGRARPSKMRKFLNLTSAGRILTSHLYMGGPEGDGDAAHEASAKEWIDSVGRRHITLGGKMAFPAESNAAMERP